MRVVFFGTPHFAQTILKYLIDQGVDLAAVVTRPDKPRGRSNKPAFSPVKECALAHNLPLYQPQKASSTEFADLLQGLNADFFVVAAYAEILKQNILDIPRLGCINVHGSILPKYRGAAPVQRAIMEGETESGVTIMKMVLQMDAGAIFEISKTPIPLEMTAGELMDKLADLGKKALWDVLQRLERGEMHSFEQDAHLVTFAKKIGPDEGLIDWNRPCEVLHNHIRGMTPNPGAWCWVELKGERKRLLIKKTLPNASCNGQPGDVLSKGGSELIVGCKTGSLNILELQPEGKKAMPAAAFLRGISIGNIKFVT